MARRATIVDSLEATGTPFLHLDLGDFVSTQKVVAEQRSRALWDEMIQMGVAATTPGRRELSEWRVLQSFVESEQIPVVSSNLFVNADGEKRPLGVRYLVRDLGGVRFGIFGLVGANDFANADVPTDAQVTFQDPIEAARELLPELRAKCEVTLLLSQLSRDDTATLLDEVRGIDVALLGNRARVEKEPVVRNETVTNQSGSRGQYAGLLNLTIDPQGRIVGKSSHNVALDESIRKEPATLARAQDAEEVSSRLQNEDLLAEKRQEIARQGTTRYLGAETCKRCHASEYDHWATTPHAQAFARLLGDEGAHGMEKGSDCASCHATGYEAAGGYVGPLAQPDLRNVQCESCHGPGTEHVRTGGAARMTEATCTGCHTPELSKDWDFPEYYELVRHQ